MQIAPEHAEAVGQRAGPRMKERLLLDWIALHAGDISPRDAQRPALVVADFADADGAGRDAAVVAARVTAHPVLVETFIDISFASARAVNVDECCHALI